ncbi:APC family permease [Microbacterium sp. G2-8]|uniref:APC family permease n=1 Tax=Microbacterium sp. G2-8 TaxID=2842454 RepID=UPI001C8A0307|nr:APC family permease [Microbacterium sp. G2-8]
MTDITDTRSTALKGNLGVPGIVFLVLAAVAPLTGMIVVAGIAIALGAGGGTPAVFFVMTVILLLFSVGYAQMAKQLTNAGGFYVFVVRGLGKTAGLVAAMIAVVGYNAFVAGAVGTSGFFTALVVADFTGLETPWWAWSLLWAALVWVFTRTGIDFSAKILAVALILEVVILVILDGAILFQTGFAMEAWAPSAWIGPTLGLGLLFAGTTFIGFEATGLFGEEARDPKRTIPKATYVAIAAIGLIAVVTTWALVSAIGVAQARDVALEHLSAGDLVFVVAEEHIGSFLTGLMQILLIVSLFAALLALHNAATRYLYAMGRIGVFPRILATTREKTGAPVVASTVQIVFSVVVAMCFAVAGLEPMLTLVPAFTGLGTLGIVVMQAIASVAIIVAFRRQRDRRWMTTFALPLIGALGLWAVTILAFANFDAVAGSDAPVITMLPWVFPLAAIVGLLIAIVLKSRRSPVWEELGQDLDRVGLSEPERS